MKEFSGKYTESGEIGQILISNYFQSIKNLLAGVDVSIENALEVACGPGYSTQQLLNILPKDIKFSASDIEEENIQIASKMLGDDVNLRKENIYSLGRKNNSMDIVFALEVLEHLKYPENALREINRVTTKHAIVAVPREPLWRVLNFMRGKYIKDWGNTPGHVQHWNVKKFKRLLIDNDFEIVEMRYPLPWIQALIKKI